jgi:hypothetical protein
MSTQVFQVPRPEFCSQYHPVLKSEESQRRIPETASTQPSIPGHMATLPTPTLIISGDDEDVLLKL